MIALEKAHNGWIIRVYTRGGRTIRTFVYKTSRYALALVEFLQKRKLRMYRTHMNLFLQLLLEVN